MRNWSPNLVDGNLINTVLIAAADVLETETGVAPDRGKIALAPDDKTAQDITVLVTLTGEIVGSVSIGTSKAEASNLVSQLLGSDESIEQELVESGIAELVNMIAGRVTVKLSEQGITTDISTPLVILGSGTTIKTVNTQKVAIPLQFPNCRLELNVALRHRDQAAALRKSA